MSPGAVLGLYALPIIAFESGGIVKLLLTSGGVTNPSIRDALVDLLGKPIADATALCIPTAQWGHPHVRAGLGVGVRQWPAPVGCMTALDWKSLGVLELTALPSIGEERWVPWVREADVLLVDGGDATYLCHWMRESGLADLLPSLPDTVWVGVSAGSMVMTPRIGDDFVGVAVRAGRQHPRGRRLLDLPASGRLPGEHHGRGGALGGRDRRSRPTPSTTRRPSR